MFNIYQVYLNIVKKSDQLQRKNAIILYHIMS